jgi:hypothetical protein
MKLMTRWLRGFVAFASTHGWREWQRVPVSVVPIPSNE